eukprot:scaffold9969_cov38-Attheya_sp.AAC.1
MLKITKLPSNNSIGSHKLASIITMWNSRGGQPRSLEVASRALHGAKKYENADINDINNKSYLPSGNYPRVPFETSRVSAGAPAFRGEGYSE